MDGSVKHTPGPWKVCGDGLKVKPVEADLFFAPIAEAFPVVEWDKENGNWRNSKHVEAHKNARLIAAAPDLLEALKAILRHGEMANIDKGGPYWGSGKKPPSMDAWAFPRHMLTEIEAAIAKAEGQA